INLKQGFSLIELLIVVAIFGLTVSLVTAAFVTFERNQKLRNGAQQLKSDLRQAQNNALSGNKGSGSAVCPGTSTLGGWYLQISTDSTNGENGKYTLSGDCRTGTDDSSFATRTIFLPNGVSISSTSLGAVSDIGILFRPLISGVTYHNAALVPPFFDADGNLLNEVGAGSALTITLTSATGGTYQVAISPSGEINEVKP
ncbi:MAG: GspH/FimT family pseudopilin, partial [Candidatus Curtissbacteria bacterium]